MRSTRSIRSTQSSRNQVDDSISETLIKLTNKLESMENLLMSNINRSSSSEIAFLKKEMEQMKLNMDNLRDRTEILAKVLVSSRHKHRSSKKEVKMQDTRHYMERYHLDKRHIGKHQLDTILFI